MTTPNPDNRADNAGRIHRNIEATRHNMELADEIIATTSDEKAKRDLQAKNERRAEAIPAMESEMRDEIRHQQQQKH